MKKKIVVFFTIFIYALTACINVMALDFKDVQDGSVWYDAISYLSRRGIITGYEDGSFRPNATITRAEACAVIIRSTVTDGYKARSIYDDVDDSFWGCEYIMAATRKDIVKGVGNHKFMPNANVTYNQIIKMVVCLKHLEGEAIKLGGWPKGYVEVAYKNEFISQAEYNSIINGTMGEQPAVRGDVARYIYNANYRKEYTATINEKEMRIGMAAVELGSPDEILASFYGFEWYVFNTDNYKKFFAAGVSDGAVVALAAAGENFEYNGYRAGMVLTEKDDYLYNLYTDKNFDNRIHALYISEIDSLENVFRNAETFVGESKLNFHFTNAFRVYHGERPLTWNNKAASSARLHSQDMADNDYFSHTSLSGTNAGERISAQGIDWSTYGENIAMGYLDGFAVYNGWVNSAGHRQNMLKSNFRYLGVGIGENSDRDFRIYYTQNFFDF